MKFDVMPVRFYHCRVKKKKKKKRGAVKVEENKKGERQDVMSGWKK